MRDDRKISKTLERRLVDAERRNADAEALFDCAKAELAAVKAERRELDEREREQKRLIAGLAWRVINGEDPAIPKELTGLVRKTIPAIRADREARRRRELGFLSQAYVPLSAYEQTAEPAIRRGFCD
jgi:hypothetical protein